MAGKRVIVKMVLENDSVCSNLNNLQFAWYDEPLLQNLSTPKVTGNTGSTDAQGLFELNLLPYTSLNVGDTGFLIVSNTNRTITQSPPHRSFSIPVKIVA